MMRHGTRLGKAAHHEETENCINKARKATGNHLALFFPRHDLNIAVLSNDNRVNEAVSQGLAESRSAGNSVRHSWSPNCEATKFCMVIKLD